MRDFFRGRLSSWIDFLKVTAVLSVVIISSLALCFRLYYLLQYPFVVDYGESAILHQAKLLFEGVWPYNRDLLSQAIYFSYSPLMQWLLSILADTPVEWLIGARSISAFSFLLSGWVISILIRREFPQSSRAQSFLLPFLVWLSWYPIYVWAGLARLDGLALLLQLLGLYFYLSAKGPSKIFCSVLWLMALLVKQTAFWIPLSLIIYEILKYKKLKDVRVWASYFLVLSVGVIALYIKSDGTLFQHLIRANSGDYSGAVFLRVFSSFVQFNAGLIVLAVCGLWLVKDLKKSAMLVSVLLLTSFFFTLGLGKEGSNVNFLIEFCVVLTFLVVLALNQRNTSGLLGVVVLVLFMALSLQSLRFQLSLMGSPDALTHADVEYSSKHRLANAEVVERLKAVQGDVWSENYSLNLFANKEVTFFPFEFQQAIKRGDLRESTLVDRVRTKELSAIVIKKHLGPETSAISSTLRSAIEQEYRVTFQNDDYLYFEPNLK